MTALEAQIHWTSAFPATRVGREKVLPPCGYFLTASVSLLLLASEYSQAILVAKSLALERYSMGDNNGEKNANQDSLPEANLNR